ncbi:MAG TPA: hypothetical protein VN428_14100 [Bryobacteraceae bacterium]|nr:hypothetical protein [Bryobacteraceae bacterium]
MALSTAEQTQLRAIIQREGGLQAFADEVQVAYIADRQAAMLTALQSAITVTVSDWAAVTSSVTAASSVGLYAALDAITQAAAARDASKLGPLMVALYGAAKKHLRP